MPNDENEQDWLDLYHHIFLTLLEGKLCAVPLKRPQRILDVGTGTGIWAIDMAELVIFVLSGTPFPLMCDHG